MRSGCLAPHSMCPTLPQVCTALRGCWILLWILAAKIFLGRPKDSNSRNKEENVIIKLTSHRHAPDESDGQTGSGNGCFFKMSGATSAKRSRLASCGRALSDEAEIHSRLSHTNIVQVLEEDPEGGQRGQGAQLRTPNKITTTPSVILFRVESDVVSFLKSGQLLFKFTTESFPWTCVLWKSTRTATIVNQTTSYQSLCL